MTPREPSCSALPVLLAAIMVLPFAGCSSSRESTRTTPEAISTTDSLATDEIDLLDDESAVAAVRRLESDPLGTEAADLRRDLFVWIAASPSLRDLDSDTSPIDQFRSSDYPHKEELLLQYLFGNGAWIVGGTGGDRIDKQEAGLRSMIAAYRSMVQAEPDRRDQFMDNLDNLRRRGELRSYIQQINETKDGR